MSGTRLGRATTKPYVLVVQDGAAHARSMAEHLQGRYSFQATTSITEARHLIHGRRRVAGSILDVALSDGSGFDLVEDLRSMNPLLPILFVTEMHDANSINRAHLLDVPLVARDNCSQNLKHFAMKVATALACTRDSVEEVLTQITHEKRLSTRESQILSVAVHGIPRAHIARRLGTSENTIKSQIRSLLDKTQKSNLSEVVWLVHSQSN